MLGFLVELFRLYQPNMGGFFKRLSCKQVAEMLTAP
jgi:hypothetical protein